MWIPTKGPIPPPVKEELDYTRFSHSEPTKGLQGALKTQGTFGLNYTRFVNELANHLLELCEDIPMPPGTISPTQVAPAFSDGTSVTSKKPTSEPHKVWILENFKAVREMLEEDLLFSGYSVKGFEEAEAVEDEIYSDIGVNKMPDLFIVDLVLNENRMQGLDFINKITDKPFPTPPIIAISGHLPSSELVKAIDAGAWKTFSKPLNMIEFHKRVAKLAAIGRNKHNFRSGQLDTNRLHRPVFLSYQNEDRRKAVSLRNQIEADDIGVWYAPDTAEPGEWRPKVRKGLEEAQVFIALLTDNYVKSPPCMTELVHFYERLNTESKPPVLIPIVYKLSQEARNDPTISQVLGELQYVDMSREENFLDDLTALLILLPRVIVPHHQ